MKNYFDVFRKYAVFAGRARRSEFWMFSLINSIIFSVLWFFALTQNGIVGGFFFVLYLAFFFGTFIPGIAVLIRRLHDTDHSGWWFLIWAIPLIGSIIVIVWLASDSTPSTNKFGPNPKTAQPNDFSLQS
jgi:uncharacterized membrane protein YhaH (DUF805 family)